MKYTLTVLEEVYEEINEASLYYEALQKGLGGRFLDHWEEALAFVVKNPSAYQKHQKHYRYIQLRHFPYLVIYEVRSSVIVIYRVIHAKKHPRKRYSSLLRRRRK